ncbi:hypothetical protein GGI12_000028 [Dipsacomyces acuminosporus]|nr:hypothetical protein GGI12_000028 [Dipsacomyces acuminosporus]
MNADTLVSLARVNADERYQLAQLKEQLAEALGEDGPSYWNALRDFVQGKLNRQEFDFYAYMYLSGDKAALHNQFILATIHNAQSGQAPPDGEDNKGFERRKRHRDESEAAGGEAANENGNDGSESGANRHARRSIKALLEDPKWRYIKELVKSLNKNERRAIKTLLKRPNITPQQAQEAIRAMKPVILPLPASQLPQSYAMDIAKGITAPLVYDTKATPDIESLSYRMVAVALEQGLVGGVTRDACELLLYALDCHLKNIVSNMIYKIRSNRALGIPVANSSVEEEALAEAEAEDEPDAGAAYDSSIAAAGRDIVSSSQGTAGTTASGIPAIAKSSSHVSASGSAALSSQQRSVASRPTTGGLRLRDRLYYSKTTLHLSDLVFSLEISPSSTVEPPRCLERCGNLMTNQELASDDAGDGDSPSAELLPHGASLSSSNTDGVPANSVAGHPNGTDGYEINGDGDEHKQRRKIRRLRARYERWFGPYVTVQYGGGGSKDV